MDDYGALDSNKLHELVVASSSTSSSSPSSSFAASTVTNTSSDTEKKIAETEALNETQHHDNEPPNLPNLCDASKGETPLQLKNCEPGVSA